jgi:NAD(P)-dependent dehydrogenase (short-subunit alcohol dehydrogenase family)
MLAFVLYCPGRIILFAPTENLSFENWYSQARSLFLRKTLKRLKMKVAIVTGGAQGIGKAITRRFLEAELKVVIVDRDAEAGTETESEYSKLGQIKFVPTDIAKEADVQRAIATTLETFDRLDILVNNAAIANPENPPIAELSLEHWNQIIAVNLTGAFLCCKYTVPHLQAHGGAIVNIA